MYYYEDGFICDGVGFGDDNVRQPGRVCGAGTLRFLYPNCYWNVRVCDFLRVERSNRAAKVPTKQCIIAKTLEECAQPEHHDEE